MKNVFIDASNNVICEGKLTATLDAAQSRNQNVVAIIENAPDKVVYKGEFRREVLYYHKLIEGEDGTDLAHYEEVPFFDNYKESKINLITRKTNQILDNGFSYDSHEFSLSTKNTVLINVLVNLAAEGEISYPTKVICKSEFQTYTIVNGAAMKAFYIAMAKALKQIMSEDIQLKASIATAATKQEIDAVIDNR